MSSVETKVFEFGVGGEGVGVAIGDGVGVIVGTGEGVGEGV